MWGKHTFVDAAFKFALHFLSHERIYGDSKSRGRVERVIENTWIRYDYTSKPVRRPCNRPDAFDALSVAFAVVIYGARLLQRWGRFTKEISFLFICSDGTDEASPSLIF